MSEFVTRTPARTQRLGAVLGAHAHPGALLLLSGPLGSGKTCLAKGVARGLGVREVVNSPTFVLVGEYQGRLPLYHVDLYRLESLGEIAALGLEDYFAGGVCVVEWAERARSLFPEDHLWITLHAASPSVREVVLQPNGLAHEELLRRVLPSLASLSQLVGQAAS